MTLAERERQLAQLAALLQEAMAGRGRAAVVGGAAAVGKTALLTAFADDAAAAGALPLTAVGAPDEAGTPWGVVDQLFGSACGAGAGLPRVTDLATATGLERGLARSFGPSLGPGNAGPEDSGALAGLAEEVCRTLIAAAGTRPLAVVVDDAHHADPASQACLARLTRRIRGARVLVVLGHTDQAPYRHSGFRLEVLRQSGSAAVPVPLLTVDGVAEVVAHRLGAEAAEAVAEHCHAVSGGNPVLLAALLDDHEATRPRAGRAPASPAASATSRPRAADAYGQAVLSCLRRFDEPVRSVAGGLSVWGGPDQVERLVGLDRATVEQALHGLDASGLADAGRFRHPAARAAVLLDMDPARRVALHRLAADLAYENGATATLIAEHLLACGGAEPRWAVPVLEEAAAHAVADGHVDQAISCLKLAGAACADERTAARLKTRLMRLEWRISPSAPVSYVADLFESMRRGHLDAADALVLARALLWHGRLDDARDVLTRLADTDFATDPEAAAELRTTRAWLRAFHAPLLEVVPGGDAPDHDAPLLVPLTPTWREEATTALDEVLTRGPSQEVVEEAERILRGARLNEMGLDTVESALLALTYGEQAGRAAPWCDRLIEEAEVRRVPGRQARLASIRAEISLREGDLPGAEAHARHALQIIPAAGWGVVIGSSLASLTMALTAMGKPEEAALALDLPVPEAMAHSRYGLHYLQARGRFNLALGHGESALRDFLACGELMGRWNVDVPGLIAWRTEAAEAWLGIGDPDRARALLQEHLDRFGKRPSRTSGVALRLLAATWELRQRPMLLRRAADVLRTSGDRYEYARALTDLAEAFRELGETRRARLVGRQARGLAQQCRAEPLARLLAASLGPAPLDAEEPEPDASADAGRARPVTAAESDVLAALSDAERRVVEFAARGYSNAEISARVFVTVSTVEQHLTRAYRKLGVRGRGELASMLVGVGDEGAW